MAPQLKLVPAKEVETKVSAKKGPVKEGPQVKKKVTAIPLMEAEEVIPAKPGKEPTGVKPVIPTGDTCCVGVCTNLNNEIDGLGQAINIRQEEIKFMTYASSRMKTRRQIATLTTKISTLKDIRFTFLDKGICKCIELPKK